MKQTIRYILIFLIAVIAFTGYFVISYTLPVYNYQSSDKGFNEIEIPWQGRTLAVVETNFENYRRTQNKPDLVLYRTSTRIWRSPNLLIDNLTNRRWSVPFAETLLTSEYQNPTKAKRAVPKEIEPVIYKDIKYIAPHFKIAGKQVQRSFIEAWDIKTHNKLWELQVYETKYNPELEQDVQDIFITSMKIVQGKLVVTNERNDVYAINIDTRKIEKRK